MKGNPLAAFVGGILSRGAVTLANAANKIQTLQIALQDDESKNDVEHFEPYGYTSHPLPNAEVLVGFIGGDRSHGVVMCAADRRFRIKSLQPGEVAIYTDEGDKIVLKRGHNIEVDTHTLTINASTAVNINTPLLQVTGGDIKADTISLKHHKHTGVQSGSSQTGEPV